jgi:hypothetical protein
VQVIALQLNFAILAAKAKAIPLAIARNSIQRIAKQSEYTFINKLN